MSDKLFYTLLTICFALLFTFLGLFIAFETDPYVIVTFPDTPRENIMDMLQRNGEAKVWFTNIRLYDNSQYLLWVEARNFGGLADIMDFMGECDIHYMYATQIER